MVSTQEEVKHNQVFMHSLNELNAWFSADVNQDLPARSIEVIISDIATALTRLVSDSNLDCLDLADEDLLRLMGIPSLAIILIDSNWERLTPSIIRQAALHYAKSKVSGDFYMSGREVQLLISFFKHKYTDAGLKYLLLKSVNNPNWAKEIIKDVDVPYECWTKFANASEASMFQFLHINTRDLIRFVEELQGSDSPAMWPCMNQNLEYDGYKYLYERYAKDTDSPAHYRMIMYLFGNPSFPQELLFEVPAAVVARVVSYNRVVLNRGFSIQDEYSAGKLNDILASYFSHNSYDLPWLWAQIINYHSKVKFSLIPEQVREKVATNLLDKVNGKFGFDKSFVDLGNSIMAYATFEDGDSMLDIVSAIIKMLMSKKKHSKADNKLREDLKASLVVLAQNKYISRELAQALASYPSDPVRESLVKNTGCHPDALVYLFSHTTNMSTRDHLLAHPNAPGYLHLMENITN